MKTRNDWLKERMARLAPLPASSGAVEMTADGLRTKTPGLDESGNAALAEQAHALQEALEQARAATLTAKGNPELSARGRTRAVEAIAAALVERLTVLGERAFEGESITGLGARIEGREASLIARFVDDPVKTPANERLRSQLRGAEIRGALTQPLIADRATAALKPHDLTLGNAAMRVAADEGDDETIAAAMDAPMARPVASIDAIHDALNVFVRKHLPDVWEAQRRDRGLLAAMRANQTDALRAVERVAGVPAEFIADPLREQANATAPAGAADA